jgi:hypothetical protein
VLWEIFPEPFGTSLPRVFDLLLIGQKPASVSSVPSKQRQGTGTFVYSFSGAPGEQTVISIIKRFAEPPIYARDAYVSHY